MTVVSVNNRRLRRRMATVTYDGGDSGNFPRLNRNGPFFGNSSAPPLPDGSR